MQQKRIDRGRMSHQKMTPVCILRPLQVKKLRSFHHSNVHVCGYGYSLALNLCNEDESLL